MPQINHLSLLNEKHGPFTHPKKYPSIVLVIESTQMQSSYSTCALTTLDSDLPDVYPESNLLTMPDSPLDRVCKVIVLIKALLSCQ